MAEIARAASATQRRRLAVGRAVAGSLALWAGLLALAGGCGRGGSAAGESGKPEQIHRSDNRHVPVPVPAPAGRAASETGGEALPAAAATPSDGLGDPRERRVRPKAVIGGCGVGCSTPEAALSLLLAQLQSQDRQTALQPLFEWSLLRVDGEELGARWASLWGDPGQHAARQQQIDEWLGRWSSWVERLSDPQGWAAMRKNGIRLRQIDAGTAEVWLRHPPLRQDETAPLWRLELKLRGEEWLVAAIDHRPVQP